MQKYSYLFTFILFVHFAPSQTIFHWEGIDVSVNFVDTDYDNNRIVVGYAIGVHDMDPGPGIVELPINKEYAAYLASYKRSGELNFAFPFYYPETRRGVSIFDLTVDGFNNIYVIGTFQDSLDLDPSSEEFWVEAGGSDKESSFLASYDSKGNFRYGVRIPEFSFSRYGNSWFTRNQILGSDNVGNVYVMIDGGEREILDINPNPDLEFIVDVPVIASYNVNGELRYAFPVPGTVAETIVSISDNGSLAIAGVLESDWDFDPTNNEAVLSGFPERGYFLATYDQDGGLQYAYKIVGGIQRPSMFLEWDRQDNLFFAGLIFNPTDFDPTTNKGLAETKFPVFGNQDIFVARYLKGGKFDRVIVIGDLSPEFYSDETIAGIKTTPAGDWYLAGNMVEGFIDLDPGVDTALIGVGNEQPLMTQTFIAGYDTSGQLIYHQRLNFQDFEVFSIAMEKNCPNLIIGETSDVGDLGSFPNLLTDVGGDSASFIIPEWTPFIMSWPVASYNPNFSEDCSALVSTSKIDLSIFLKAYPNPASNQLFLEFAEPPGSIFTQIFDAFGREIQTNIHLGISSRIDLAIKPLPSNLYWLRIIQYDTGKQTTIPIMIE